MPRSDEEKYFVPGLDDPVVDYVFSQKLERENSKLKADFMEAADECGKAIKERDTLRTQLAQAQNEAQPLTAWSDNVLVYRLGNIAREACNPSRQIGDEIDRGLVLLRLLGENGFSVIRKSPKSAEGEPG